MKFLNRQIANHSLTGGMEVEKPPVQREPEGHLHPNYRHWNWFQPGDQRAQ